MNRSTTKARGWKALLWVLVVAVPGLAAPRGVNPVNALPAFSASAEAPKNVQSGKIEFYKLTGKDLDTYNAPPVPAQVAAPDDLIKLDLVMAESMVPGTRVWGHRGMADDGTHTWDVGGEISTVTAQTIFLDK